MGTYMNTNPPLEQLPAYTSHFSWKNKLMRLAWSIAYYSLFRIFFPPFLNSWRVFIIKCFGAKIGKGTVIYANARIWAPWNMIVGRRCCIGPNVFYYNPSPIILGDMVTISQNSYLCGGSHDIASLSRPFISAPIVIEDLAWVCANSFIMMGVTIGKGAIVGATSSVFKNVEPWHVVGGNPAKFIKIRTINHHD